MKNSQMDTEVEKALGIQNKLGYYDEYAPIFGNTCNNHKALSKIVEYQNKKVLLPASSGDPWLSAVYNGCTEGDLYDLNYLTRHYAYLRISALLFFPCKEDFLKFMVPNLDSELYLNQKFLSNMQTIMPAETFYFWERYLAKASRENISKFISFDHCKGYDLYSYIQSGMPFYESQEEYNRLRNIMQTKKYPGFIQTDIREFNTSIKETYDIIDLCNIIECAVLEGLYKNGFSTVDTRKQEDLEQAWIDFIESDVQSLLKTSGTILINYRENVDPLEGELADLLFSYKSFESHVIPSKNSYAYDGRDAVAIYQKK